MVYYSPLKLTVLISHWHCLEQERERELIKSGFGFGLDLSGGMALHDGYLTASLAREFIFQIGGGIGWTGGGVECRFMSLCAGSDECKNFG